MTHICLCSHSGTQPSHLCEAHSQDDGDTFGPVVCLSLWSAWLVAGGGGLQREFVMVVPYFESLADVYFGEGILQALHEVKCVLLAIIDSLVTHKFLNVISLK